MSLKRPLIRTRLPVKLFTRKLDRKMQRGGTTGKGNGMLYADIGCDLLLDLIDICADGGNPVRPNCIIHPILLVSVHGRRRQPNLLLKGFNPRKARIV